MGIEKFESQSGILRILLHLRTKEASITDLVQKAKINQSALYSALPKLLEMELIKEKNSKSFPFKRMFKLTENGKKVAKHLLEIEEILRKCLRNKH
jgi:predicted transcriptional regulator